jgi:hypothetical protein
LRLPGNLDLLTLKDSRVKVVVPVHNGPDHLLSREQQDNLRKIGRGESQNVKFCGKQTSASLRR